MTSRPAACCGDRSAHPSRIGDRVGLLDRRLERLEQRRVGLGPDGRRVLARAFDLATVSDEQAHSLRPFAQ